MVSLAFVGFLSLVPVAAMAEDTAGPKPAQTLRVAYVSSLSFSPLFRAIAKGYFAEEGIDLQLQIVTSSSDTVAFLGRGQLDAAFGNISDTLFNAIQRGMDVKIAGGVSYYPSDKATLSPSPLLVSKKLKDAGTIKNVEDLRGRKIAFNTRGGIIEYESASALREYGMTVADLDVVTIPFPDQPTALANGAIDAAMLPEPLATLAVQKDLAEVLVPNPAPGVLATVLLLGQTLLLEKNAELTDKFLRAVRRAAADLQTPGAIMSDENVAIWAKYTQVPAKVIAATAPYVFDKDLAVDMDSLMRQQQYLLDTNQITAQVPADTLISIRFAKTK